MSEQQGASRQPESPLGVGLSASAEFARRWQEFATYIGQHDHDKEQAAALLQLAVDMADQPRGKASLRLEWRNIYAAVATLSRTDSETLHARLTIGFSPAEFKWMLQNKALYTWHSQPVRFQRCLQCMVAKLGTTVSSSTQPSGQHHALLASFKLVIGSGWLQILQLPSELSCRSVWKQRRKDLLVMSKQIDRCSCRPGCQ